MTRWQILIASVHARTPLLEELLATLAPQLSPYVTVLIDRDDGEAPVGVKRTRLVEQADADYICFVDDDDQVSDDYTARVVSALQAEPDAVGFNLAYSRDGIGGKDAVHSSRFERWHEDEHGYYRTVNHLNPVRRELALRCLPFLDGFGEDCDYAARLAPLIRSEVFLDGDPVYHYRYSSVGSLFAGGPVSVGADPGLRAFEHVRVLTETGCK